MIGFVGRRSSCAAIERRQGIGQPKIGFQKQLKLKDLGFGGWGEFVTQFGRPATEIVTRNYFWKAGN